MLLDCGRAIGVVPCDSDGAQSVIRTNKEVILSGGAINSPQLLMLSGEARAPIENRHHLFARLAGSWGEPSRSP